LAGFAASPVAPGGAWRVLVARLAFLGIDSVRIAILAHRTDL